jgi:hypothetical protein
MDKIISQPIPSATTAAPPVSSTLKPLSPSTAVMRSGPFAPASSQGFANAEETEWTDKEEGDMVLELQDGLVLRGTSFGAEGKGVSGECVFQTG